MSIEIVLVQAREAYAEAVCAAAKVVDPRVIDAFKVTPREAFSPTGPWKVYRPSQQPPFFKYELTRTAMPEELYQDLSIELEPGSFINNGLPSVIASWLGNALPPLGGAVVQVGAGLGYYTAILAVLVGPSGSVRAAEIDVELGSQAQANLAHLPQVDLLVGDGANLAVQEADLVMVHAGISDLPLKWLTGLSPRGSLIVSLTFTSPEFKTIGLGVTLLARPVGGGGYSARFLTTPYITTSHSLRSEKGERLLREAMMSLDYDAISSIRLDEHAPAETCWLHRDGWCVSRLEATAKAQN